MLVMLVLCCNKMLCAGEAYLFRLYLTDKPAVHSQKVGPEQFLSAKSIERRMRQGYELDSTDAPVDTVYMRSIASQGARILAKSRWMNTVAIALADSVGIESIKPLSFIDSVQWIGKQKQRQPAEQKDGKDTSHFKAVDAPLNNYWGNAKINTTLHKADIFQKKGYTGQGISVAVIDAGFKNLNRISAFDSMRVVETRNFVNPGVSVYEEDDHGTKVLSCLAARQNNVLVGSAPDADYHLLKSEVIESEYSIEEDYWIEAVEYADSAGVDIISSSLGYWDFENNPAGYTQEYLTGKHAFISRAASKAIDKGMLLVVSAGNEGSGSWRNVTFPSDADNVLTVGAIDKKKKKSIFSSAGAQGKIKPEVVSLGSECAVYNANGSIEFVDGTSFATPILAGWITCLWQALPSLTNREIYRLVIECSSLYKKPDADIGYGIPDMQKAYQWGLRLEHQKKN